MNIDTFKNDNLLSNLFKTDSSLGRFDFFIFFTLRSFLLYFIFFISNTPALTIPLIAYFSYDLIRGRLKSLSPEYKKIKTTVFLTFFWTHFLYMAYNFPIIPQFFIPPKIMFSFAADRTFIEPISKFIFINSIVMAVSGLIFIISLIFLIFKKGDSSCIFKKPESAGEVFSSMFKTSGTFSRSEYVLTLTVAQLVYAVVSLIFAAVFLLPQISAVLSGDPHSFNSTVKYFYSFLQSCAFFVLLFVLFVTMIKRLRNLGKSGWWSLLIYLFSFLGAFSGTLVSRFGISGLVGRLGQDFAIAFNLYGYQIYYMVFASFKFLSLTVFCYLFLIPGKSEN